MKLISCDNCGIVLDADKLEFPKDVDSFGVNNHIHTYDEKAHDYRPFLRCPCCKEKVIKP